MGCTTKVCMCVSYQLRRSSNPQWIFSNAAQRPYRQAVAAGAQERHLRYMFRSLMTLHQV
jgi:hypothetical protein